MKFEQKTQRKKKEKGNGTREKEDAQKVSKVNDIYIFLKKYSSSKINI